jgi:hypothetical protein
MTSIKYCVLLLLLALVAPSRAQTNATPDIYRSRVSLARCKSASSLRRLHATLHHPDKLTELVFYARLLTLLPRNVDAARGLLKQTPAGEEEQNQLMQIMDAPEGTSVGVADVLALAAVYDRWPELMARAVLLAPEFMKTYVSYFVLAPNDIHSNFTGSAMMVCRKRPAQFRSALAGLQPEDQKFIADKVFDSKSCKAIFVSEAE